MLDVEGELAMVSVHQCACARHLEVAEIADRGMKQPGGGKAL